MSSVIHSTIAAGDTMADQYETVNQLTDAAPASNLSTVEWLLKNDLKDADASAVLTRRSDGADAANKVIIDDAVNWKYTVKADSTATAAISPGRYKQVCMTIDAAGNEVEAFRGDFVVLPRASDAAS
ncbi:MAG: hypothetical protein ACE5HU_09190 [Acidobacteriota bacterium]